MDVADYIDAVAQAGAALADAATAAGLQAPVPSCPDWTVRDLVRHQGGVHRWARSIVATPRTEPWDVDLPEVVGDWPPDDELLDWFADGVGALVAALTEAPASLACWTFLVAPSPLVMWSRRQAHETTVHRVDAELAAGRPLTPVSPTLAADGVDELLACFITRPRSRLRSDPARVLRVGATDAPGDWLVTIGPDQTRTAPGSDAAPADCVVAGRAWDLYLALWSRQPTDDLSVTGDPAVLDLFLDRVHVRWA